MELNTILELVKAGFTKDEIMQMEQPKPTDPNPQPVPVPVENPPQPTEPKPAPAQVVEPVAPAVPTPAPVPQKVEEPAQPSMADVMQSIAKLTSAIQANAIAQSIIPNGMQKQPTAEDMLAEIIRPTYKGVKEE